MAHASTTPPMLNLTRSSSSGSYVMTSSYVALYSENTSSSTIPYFFIGAEIDLSNMAAGDTIDIRTRKVISSGGDWTAHNTVSYSDAQPSNHLIVKIDPVPDVYGFEVSIRQTAGTMRTVPCEFYQAKRIGL